MKGGGLERFWTDTELYRCRGGNQLLAHRLAATIPPDRLLLRTIVRAVIATADRMTVTIGDGRMLETDDVILSVPPSVWNRIAFEPPLPPHLVPQMGSNVKFLMAMKDRFWTRHRLAPELFSDGPVQLTWEGTGSQGGDGAAMVAFSGGSSAETVREWTATERNDRYLSHLQSVFPDIRAQFVRGRLMDWPADPWTRASNSFPAPGQVTTIGPVLSQGLGRLHFAGEHTCYAFTRYMEGALDSGVAIARKLAVRDGILRDRVA